MHAVAEAARNVSAPGGAVGDHQLPELRHPGTTGRLLPAREAVLGMSEAAVRLSNAVVSRQCLAVQRGRRRGDSSDADIGMVGVVDDVDQYAGHVRSGGRCVFCWGSCGQPLAGSEYLALSTEERRIAAPARTCELVRDLQRLVRDSVRRRDNYSGSRHVRRRSGDRALRDGFSVWRWSDCLDDGADSANGEGGPIFVSAKRHRHRLCRRFRPERTRHL